MRTTEAVHASQISAASTIIAAASLPRVPAVFMWMPPGACKARLPFESDEPSANSPKKMSTSRFCLPREAGRWLLRAQAIQQLRRREAVRDQTRAQLKLADGGAGLGSQPTVRLADFEAGD